MSVHLIPLVPSNPDYDMNVTLDGIRYIMHVYWNDRDAAFYFDMFAADRTPIATGIKITLGCYLGRTTQAAPFNAGVIIAMDTYGNDIDAGIDDLGARVQMYYVPTRDLMGFQTAFQGTLTSS